MHLFISQKDGIQDIQMMGFKKVNVNLPKASARGFPPGHRHVDPSKLTSPTHRKKHQTSGSEASRRQQLLPIKEFENLNQFHQWTSADWWVDGFGGFMGWWVDGLGWVTWIQEKLGQEWDKATSPGLAGKSLHRTRLDSFKGRKMIVENRWNRWYHDNLMIIPVFIIPIDEVHSLEFFSSSNHKGGCFSDRAAWCLAPLKGRFSAETTTPALEAWQMLMSDGGRLANTWPTPQIHSF